METILGQGLRNWTTSIDLHHLSTGDVGWNTDDEIAEIYNGTEWVPLGQGSGADPGEVLFVSTGTRTWTVPDGVEQFLLLPSVAVAVDRRPRWRRGTGGGLGWRNNITVTPGSNITVQVGTGGPGGDNESRMVWMVVIPGSKALDKFLGGGGRGGRGTILVNLPGGNYTGAGGGRGGTNNNGSDWRNGGTGAGGYTGRGGEAAIPYNTPGQPGTGGGGGAGSGGNNYYMGGGGGTGVYGQGPNGSGGPGGPNPAPPGQGGSGGQPGSQQPAPRGGTRGNGGLYGGAGGGTYYGNNQGGRGANGAVRVIWGDDNVSRQFPNTNTSQGSSVTVQQV